ncbi:ras GEF [Aspergillus eucalypticola CBS 122712]|uniref:Ras GEF n=1 Tax=Aspergillus eucalypticola (strain CBS 122712 / IBT 29274) TaxID=1448314 RepID=A0A317WGD3_ASPEC|nr:ras GEF [Aspergillus eucalypticola CBS 122712]PWY85359.1 ras GEF [Aspergillus eucalypticola CBS 122712]
MASQPSRRERASSDKADAAPFPQRPGLPSRTISAPVGGLYRLDSARTAMESGNKVGRTLLEEDENPPSAGGDRVPSSTREETTPKPSFPHVSIAVVGPDHVGKSTFIETALDMKHPLTSRTTTKKMSLDGTVYLVRLMEIDTLEITIGNNGEVNWPLLGSDSPPTVDGVLVLLDMTQPASFPEFTELLDSLTASDIPFTLVASKCDIQPPDSPVEPILGGYEIHRTSPDSPRSQKMCIALVLRSVISRKYDWHHSRTNSETPTAVLSGAAGGPITGPLDPAVDGYGVDRQPTDPATSANLASNGQAFRYARSNSHPVRPHTPPSGSRLASRKQSVSGESSPSKDLNRQHRLHTAWRNSGGSDAFSNFLEMGEDFDGPRSAPSSPGSKDQTPSESSSNDAGFTFDELVDRLVAQPMSKQDSKFASIFLCLYRKFAAPCTLLNALINRFERNENDMTDQLDRIAVQLRLLGVMAQWISEYPGDLAYPKTRKRITDFVTTLEKSHFYMFAAKEIGSYLEGNADDDNIGWPYRDGDMEEPDTADPPFQFSGRSSPSIFLGAPPLGDEGEEEEEDPIYSMSALDLSEGAAEPASRLSGSMSNSFTSEKPGTIASQSFTFLSTEAAQREAHNLDLTPRIPLTKIQWRQLMEIPDEDFARELTRMDWIMFNSFRPRDLVRHVSISGVEKDKILSLKHVNRMIKQFNHVAFFVASVILLRDKPKHRAKALEKFMNIALPQKLRRLNNYNSLGAVIAGINGTPVHRLSQTRDLVPVQTQKDFMRLVILMGTQKSHFAYRLAWDNSFAERIPFLPLHRRDLVSAEEGNKTFVGDNKNRINWRKFEVMGEVVLGIQRSQKTPYPHMSRYEEVERLILEIKLSGDDEGIKKKKSKCPRPRKQPQPTAPSSANSPAGPSPLLLLSNTASATSRSGVVDADAQESLRQHRLDQANQFAIYAKAQRVYAELVERYNPGTTLDEEERIRLTARRVGWDLPVEAGKERVE